MYSVRKYQIIKTVCPWLHKNKHTCRILCQSQSESILGSSDAVVPQRNDRQFLPPFLYTEVQTAFTVELKGLLCQAAFNYCIVVAFQYN